MLNRDSHEALYLQLARLLEGAIDGGVYQPFERLPTESELVAAHGVSRITVRRALDYLLERRRIVRKQGKGTFVAGPVVGRDLASLRSFAESLAQRSDREDAVELMAWGLAPPPERARVALGTDEPTLHRLVRRFHRAGRLLGLSETFFSPALGPLAGEEPAGRATCDLVETVARQPIRRAEISVRLAVAGAEQADLLGVEETTPLLAIERVSLDSHGRALEHSTFWVVAADAEFRLDGTGRFPIPDHLAVGETIGRPKLLTP